jgi:ribosomal protein S18 acetylase RimI-like enzyme
MREEGLSVIQGGKVESGEKPSSVVGSKPWANKLRTRAKELAGVLESGYMEMAQILYLVYDTPVGGDRRRGPLFTEWGYENFAEYAEKELQIGRKRAERLRKIWFTLEIEMRDLDPDLKQRIVNLGFCKVRELIRVLTVRNAKHWVQQAEVMNYYSLQASVTDEKRRQGVGEALLAAEGDSEETSEGETSQLPDPTPPEILTRESFAFYPEQLGNVRLALEKASSLSHSDKKSHNLDLICTDFLATNDFVAGDVDKRLRYVAKMERVLGLRLVAVDDAGEVLYGLKTLELTAGVVEGS